MSESSRSRMLKRVLTLARRLQTAKRPPRLQVLADELRVSTRTIRRDLTALADAGWSVQKSA